MNKNLFKILQMDSIIEKLTWQERVILHLYIQGRADPITIPFTKNIYSLYDWIDITNWNAPLMKIGQDRLKYCYESRLQLWFPVEEYRDISPDIRQCLKKIE